MSSNFASFAGSTFSESIVIVAVGFLPTTDTGTVLISHESVPGSGESLIVS
jgi:hypothetical protein